MPGDEDSLHSFGTEVFGIETMTRLIQKAKTPQSGIFAYEWFCAIPQSYKFWIYELSNRVFAARHRGLLITDANVADFVTDLHETIWKRKAI